MRYLLKIAVSAMLVSGMALGAAACGDDDDSDGDVPEEVQLTETDSGKSFEVADGGKVIVALASNPSTGFSWAVAEPGPANLDLEGEPKFVPAGSTTPVVGAGGTEVFTFKAVGKGESTLKVEYRRSFENNPPEKTFTVEIDVK